MLHPGSNGGDHANGKAHQYNELLRAGGQTHFAEDPPVGLETDSATTGGFPARGLGPRRVIETREAALHSKKHTRTGTCQRPPIRVVSDPSGPPALRHSFMFVS